eukprot:30831-Pelagococcus_subviridis.AAC.14
MRGFTADSCAPAFTADSALAYLSVTNPTHSLLICAGKSHVTSAGAPLARSIAGATYRSTTAGSVFKTCATDAT